MRTPASASRRRDTCAAGRTYVAVGRAGRGGLDVFGTPSDRVGFARYIVGAIERQTTRRSTCVPPVGKRFVCPPCRIRYGSSAVSSNPNVSGNPHIRFAHCTACPLAPLHRLSSAESRIQVPFRSSEKSGAAQRLVAPPAASVG